MIRSKGASHRLQQLAIAAAFITLAGCDNDPLIHQDGPAAEAAYERQAERWSRWALEQPWSTGPLLDTDGSECGLGQSGNTWYLAGTPGEPAVVERDCTIPRNKRLFFPLLNRWVAPPPELIIEGDPENDLAAWTAFVTEYFAAGRAGTCELTLRIDGHDLLPDLETMDEELYVQILEPFNIELGDDNFATPFGGTAGPRTTWVDGHFALLHPLPPGDYTLELGGRQCDENGDTVFETMAIYTLHIEE